MGSNDAPGTGNLSIANKEDRNILQKAFSRPPSRNDALISEYYKKTSAHTTDLVMDIHARLNNAKMMRDDRDPKQLEYSISSLLKMARKDRFESYRDYIYYSTAQLSLQPAQCFF